MKTPRTTILLTLLLACGGLGLAQQVRIPESLTYKVAKWDGTSFVAAGTTNPKLDRQEDWMEKATPNDLQTPSVMDPDYQEEGSGANKSTLARQISVLRNFTANNLAVYCPSDNSMGISDNGFIVSADNLTIDYFTDAPDTLVQFQRHHIFYGDTALRGLPFDPRVIYDRYANRFIVVSLIGGANSENRLMVSFSTDEDPQAGWNHYTIMSDSLDPKQWFDFPTIGMNKDELFISGNMLWDSTNQNLSGNKVFQIKKANGYAGDSLKLKMWMDILDAEGDLAGTMVPVSEGLMRDSYQKGIYLASTKELSGADERQVVLVSNHRFH